MQAIELSGLKKTFRRHTQTPVQAVKGIDLTLEEGEIVAFLGPNGAGKTTTVDMILGLTSPTEGTVSVFGAPPQQAIKSGNVAAMLQTGGLLRDLTVGETASLIAAQYDHPLPVSQALERAGIAKLAKRRVSKCSGGEQQKLRFALALLPDPRLIILDEPTAGMDVSARISFWETMRKERHRTILFATHYLEEAQEFADRIVLLDEGELIADGSTQQIRSMTSIRTIICQSSNPQALASTIGTADPEATTTIRGTDVRVETGNSDRLLSVILSEGGHDIEVVAPSLESAFLHLTTKHRTKKGEER